MSHPLAGEAPGSRAPGDPYRYGVYLRPDPATCLAVTTVTTQLRAQYGLVSAGAFPPHATLVGSQHLAGDVGDLLGALTARLSSIEAFPVYNVGPRKHGFGVVYDVDHDADGAGRNEPLRDLADAVARVMAQHTSTAPYPDPADFHPETFSAHLSLASHDLLDAPDLREEVLDYVTALPVTTPAAFTGDVVSLYRTRSDDWTGRWWRSLTWTHMASWRLPAALAAESSGS